MSKTDEYRQRAAICAENAASAESDDSRQAWLSIAQDWLGMIPEKASEPPAELPEVQPAALEQPAETAQVIDGVALSSLEQEIARWMHDSRQPAG